MSRSTRSLTLAALATVGLASAAQAGTFIVVATTNTAMPGYGSDFASFSSLSAGIVTDGTDVVFYGANGSSQEGIYDYNISSGNLNSVANLSTSVPGGGTYTNFQYPSISNGNVAFVGTTTNTTNSSTTGVYAATPSGGSLKAVADQSTVIPNQSPTKFGYVYPTAQSSGNLIFAGGSSGAGFNGIYTSSGGSSISTVVDSSMSVPTQAGVTKYGTFPGATVAGNSVAFESAENTISGIFTTTTAGGTAKFIAGSNSSGSTGASTVPGSTATFTTQYGPVTDGTNVVFWGQSSAGSGLYLYPASGGAGTAIFTTSTTIPGTSLHFDTSYSATAYAVSNGIVVFNGEATNDTTNIGIYAYQNGMITKIIAAGDPLDGSTVTYAALEGFDGNGIANGIGDYVFYAQLQDGVSGVFLDPVPEPGSLALLGLGSLFILRRRRSTRA